MPRDKHTTKDSSEAAAAAETKSSEDVLLEAQRRVTEAEEAALRAAAEVQNLKRRQREEMERIQDTATKELVLALLPVVDDLERALDAAGQTDDVDALRAGVELTLNKLRGALATVGVERLPGPGTAFDPELHEAALQVPPSDEFASGIIAQELRSGYTQHGHLIRASLVAVAHE